MAEHEHDQHSVLDNIEQGIPSNMKPLLEAAEKYKKHITLAIAVILGLTVIWSGVRWYNGNQIRKTRAAMGEILLNAQGQERLDKVAELAKNAPGDMRAAVLFEAASLSLELNQYDKAEQYYKELAANADDDTAIVASLGQAKSALLAGDAKKALEIIKPLAESAPKHLITPINRQLALAAEQAGDTATAIKAYETLEGAGVMDKQFVDYKLAQLKQ